MTWTIVRTVGKVALLLVLTIIAAAFISLCVLTYFPQSFRLHNRTVDERQFISTSEYGEPDLAKVRAFESAHGLKPETRGGLRLSIFEWPDWQYLVSIDQLADGTAKGVLHSVAYNGAGPGFEQEFSLNEDEASLLFESFDHQIGGFGGSTEGCTDGTGFTFERWDNGRVKGGGGNAACQRHYAELMSLVAETLVVKLNDVPFEWQSWFAANRYLTLRAVGK